MAVPSNETFLVRNATGIALIALTAIMVLASLMFLSQARSRDLAAGRVTHTYEVIGHLEQLFGNIKEMVVGQRGYMLTGEEKMLQPYYKALKDGPTYDAGARILQQQHSVAQKLDILKRLTADNPIQQANLDELQASIKNLQAYLAHTIAERKQGTTSLESADTSKLYMDEIRNMVRVMETEESNLLALRREKEAVTAVVTKRMTLGTIFVFYVLLSAAVVVYQRNRAKSAQEAARYTVELEKREEELKMQQEELKASNEEIEASNEELEEKSNALEEQNARIRKQSQELEQAKQQIEEKAQELETASRYKSEFLANMSHELRTPLNSLLILARSFASNEEGNLTPDQVEEARVIHNGGLELLNLINDILDLSKVEAGKLNIIAEDVYIKDIAGRMKSQFGPVARDRGLNLNVRLDPGLPEMFSTDAQRVEQILKNLLSNAFKFTESGSVTLDIHHPGGEIELQRASLLGSRTIAFAVTDTGIGIDESKFKDIFEAFQQEDGSTERHYGGTGLGLTIARKFAHMLGGEIHVTSKKGEGSTFTLFLPQTYDGSVEEDVRSVTPRPAKASQPLPAANDGEGSAFVADDRKNIDAHDKAVLIIEDDRDFATTLMKIARQRGYKCLVAGDGKSGLLLAAQYPVSAIVLDLRLPDMDGNSVLDQLKHSLDTRHIPVHIISGANDTQTVVPLRKGAIGYLTKPVTVEEIAGAFKRMEDVGRAGIKKLLVVEDDQKTQVAVQSLLRQKNIEITMAGTGRDATAKMATTQYDCVILDLKLPDMSGFEWLEKMQDRLGEDKTPPVIVYTAQELTEEENRNLSQYTDSIVIKGASSSERLLDEVTLFLHSVESTLSEDQKAIIRMNHDPDKALQNRTIMLVDDDMRNTFALSKLLKKHGMSVIIADNGQMALEKLRTEEKIELVIMDIMMPIMDGYQAMREIRMVDAWKNLPIIALTARAMPEEQERCMEAGANDYLTKPVDVDRLLMLLRVWLFRQERAA